MEFFSRRYFRETKDFLSKCSQFSIGAFSNETWNVFKTDEQLFFEEQVNKHIRVFKEGVDSELDEKEEEVETKLRTSYPKLFSGQKKKN